VYHLLQHYMRKNTPDGDRPQGTWRLPQMPINQCTTGCYWTTRGRLWMALEAAMAVLTGLHDLRFLPLNWILLDRAARAGKTGLNGGKVPGWFTGPSRHRKGAHQALGVCRLLPAACSRVHTRRRALRPTPKSPGAQRPLLRAPGTFRVLYGLQDRPESTLSGLRGVR